MIYVKYIKHSLDVAFALLLLLCLSPIFILLIVILLATQGKTIVYSQLRSGQHLNKFNLYKFRTLEVASYSSLSMYGRKYTKTGRFMRKSGLDELPQLINILKGEMSFVGPRPLPIEYEEKYSEAQLRRFERKPGLTGWAQVNGRNETSWAKRFELDCWYIDHTSMLVDVKVLLRTVTLLIRGMFRKGADEVTMEVFKGTRFI